MKFILYFFLIIFLGVFLFELLTRKYKQPYQFNMVIGSPGAGKSTMYCQLAHYYLSRGYHVYGTDPVKVVIKDKKTREKAVVQVKEIDAKHLYRYRFPEDSVILLDELGTVFHNRAWKEFNKENVLFWKHFRHCHLIVWGWSQSFDIDLTLRNLVSQFWIQERKMRVFSVARRLVMRPVVVHPQGEGVARITDDFVEDPKLLKPVVGGMKIVYIPRWVNNFDSYVLPDRMVQNMDIDYSLDPVPYERPVPVRLLRRRARRDKFRIFLLKCIDKCQYIWYYNLARIKQSRRRLLPWKRK